MSNTSLLLFFSLLPIVLILVIVYNIDKNKEPLLLLLIFFVLGVLSCFAVLEISNFLGKFIPFMSKASNELNFIETILYAFLGVALIEELCKWVVVYILGYNNKEFDELYDIIVYSIFMALGFAFFENILYIFTVGELNVAILRAVLAIPAHACYAIFMGYYFSKAKQNQTNDKKYKYLVFSLLFPTILHGVYDYCLMSGSNLLIIIFIGFTIWLDIFSIKKIKETVANNQNIV